MVICGLEWPVFKPVAVQMIVCNAQGGLEIPLFMHPEEMWHSFLKLEAYWTMLLHCSIFAADTVATLYKFNFKPGVGFVVRVA